ncbi:MAG TPA: NUMOD3 domain-containing DNA-binding protein [Smithellaceae bacterium]|nr:NUMOD3 domain-containing DNA-binding protein [Smithellaceae bacterium]
MPPPKKGTPEYEKWLNSPKILAFGDWCSKVRRGKNHPNYGKSMSETQRASISLRMRGENNPNFGKFGTDNPCYGRTPWNKGKSCLYTSGEKSHFWRGGVSFEPYCPKFNEHFKRRVRSYYNNQCVKCGKTKEKNGKELDVHHVNFDKQTCCKNGEEITDKKFVALCVSCHSYASNHPGWAIEYYTKLVDEKYNGISYLSEEEYIKRTRAS